MMNYALDKMKIMFKSTALLDSAEKMDLLYAREERAEKNSTVVDFSINKR